MSNSYGHAVAKVATGDKTEVHVKDGVEYNGMKLVDIRKYVSSSGYTGYTKDGVTVPRNAAVLEQLVQGLQQIIAQIKTESA